MARERKNPSPCHTKKAHEPLSSFKIKTTNNNYNNVLVNVNGGLVVWMNSGIADAMDQLLDEVDEEEAATKEDFGRWNPVQIVGGAFDTFANLIQILVINKTTSISVKQGLFGEDLIEDTSYKKMI